VRPPLDGDGGLEREQDRQYQQGGEPHGTGAPDRRAQHGGWWVNGGLRAAGLDRAIEEELPPDACQEHEPVERDRETEEREGDRDELVEAALAELEREWEQGRDREHERDEYELER
jgi:hypothetical protein